MVALTQCLAVDGLLANTIAMLVLTPCVNQTQDYQEQDKPRRVILMHYPASWASHIPDTNKLPNINIDKSLAYKGR